MFSTLPSAVRQDLDVLVVGGGPVGLAAANALHGLNVLVIDAGKAVRSRNRYHHSEITSGFGGAGLFSDGKFSFFPASTELWRLADQEDLRTAYAWTSTVLHSQGLKVPPFPANEAVDPLRPGRWHLKKYPSAYLTLEQRMSLTDSMVDSAEGYWIAETSLEHCRWDERSRRFVATLHERGSEQSIVVRSRALIIGTGRFGPIDLREMDFLQFSFRRLEFGVRIEQEAEEAFFRREATLDPKLRLVESDHVEWRTFCACRNGETVLSDTAGQWTVSGRADCPPTGRSNIGFNTRILDPRVAAHCWSHLKRSTMWRNAYFRLPLQGAVGEDPAVVRRLHEVLGPTLVKYLLRGIRLLAAEYPELTGDSAEIVGPTIEGVGWYPELDRHLAVFGLPMWIAGDACGRFRGIVAGLVSGHYAALRCVKFLGASPRERRRSASI